MKNLTHLSDDRLVSDVKALCADERRITTEILLYLSEIDSRKSYLDLGYGSLFEFTVKELKYSEGSAARRISAMKLMRQCPEVKEEIQTGSLSVTTVSLAKRATEGRPIEEKKEVLLSLQNLSQREVEQVLADRYPEKVQVQPEKERVLPGGSTQITFTVSRELMEKLERLKEIFSHQSLDPSLSELLEMMANQLLKKLDPAAPHETLLVLDATVGRNALSQVEAFDRTAGVTGVVMTKLEGTARGGVLVPMAEASHAPIKLIGVGEGIEDPQPFDAGAFARSLVGLEA